ncbi:hypothetical protein QOZ80_8BG0662850 [Eleusine coracana subsp. coracana]|nr:hypothetical protein QOZ80_8BG0662850 [Eleusine coracana subsp. coracana]
MEVALPETPTWGSDQEILARLPMEILTEILARLPAKSVGRFRCVSHAWSAMLSSPHFLDLHARRANRHPKLLLTPVGSSYDGDVYSWRPGGPVEKLMLDCFGDGTAVPLTKPCRGLVLIRSTDYGGYFVCNPSVGTVVPIPDSKVPLKMIWRPTMSDANPLPFFSDVSYGLGYCELSKEYKVVRFFCYTFGEDNLVTSASCEVFVLDTPAYWRPAAEKPPLCSLDEKKPAVFLNGYLHFLCTDGGITTFNVSDETFGSLPPPLGFENAATVLTELDGCLCVCYDNDEGYYVYVLRDYYKEAHWEKLCYIHPSSWSESERVLLESLWVAPLGMYHSYDREKIMFGTGDCKVFAVDADGSAQEILLTPDDTIIGSCEDDDIPPLGLFEESLTSVGRTTEEMILSSPITKAWSDILKWLPTHSVLELSLVCREWRAMIMTDYFVQSHAIHANLNKSPRIMFIMDPRFGVYMDMEDCIAEGGPSLISDLVCSPPCHGLNAGSCSSWDFICNPAIGYCEYIELDGHDATFFAGRNGLGYNLELNRHVVVHIIYKEKNMETRHYQLQCKMRYVNDQQWDSIDSPPRPIADIPPTFVSGKIYWMVEPALGPISSTCEIVAFNISTAEFEVLQGPPCSHESGRMTILRLQDVLCVASSDRSANTLDIWMMKDSGIWLMEYHIELEEFSPNYLSENTIPLAIYPKDGRILLSTGFSLGYYDPKKAVLEKIYTECRVEHIYKFCPIICEESLVCPLGPF